MSPFEIFSRLMQLCMHINELILYYLITLSVKDLKLSLKCKVTCRIIIGQSFTVHCFKSRSLAANARDALREVKV